MSTRPQNDLVGVKIEIREWELNENSTVYDNQVATPSDETLQIQWIVFITILSVALVLMVFVFIAMLRDKICRRNSFNTYVLFLLGPDITFTACCIISCSLNLRRVRYYSVDGCVFQSLYSMSAVASSAWINAIVVYQLHRMLVSSRRALRYHPPTREKVVKQCLMVYVYSLFLGSWSNWGLSESWWPIRNNIYSGIMCLPMPYDLGSTLFFYLVYAPLLFLLPLFFICYIVFDIARNDLLPHRDQRKTLMIFFRLLLVYFVMWVPALFLALVGGNWLPWPYVATGAVWAHLQGAVSAGICMLKPDVKNACQNLLCCSTRQSDQAAVEQRASIIPTNLLQPSKSFLGFEEGSASMKQEDELDGNDNSDDEVRKSTTSKSSSSNTVNKSAYEVALGLEAGELHSLPPSNESGS